jgi:uncharacterized membrane protein YeiH
MLLYLASIAGSFVFAISGALAAGKKGLDWVGVTVFAIVTAIGGGTLRDLILGRKIFWLNDQSSLWAILAATAFTIIYCRYKKPPKKSLAFFDALGLALFTITGLEISIQYSDSVLITTMMAVSTGVAGGVIRDLLSNEIPYIFKSSEHLYASASLGGILTYHLLNHLNLSAPIPALSGMSVIAGIRLISLYYSIMLPPFSLRDE